MNLFQIEAELRSLASELRGHDDVDQWLHLYRLADELEGARREVMARSNKLARQALPFAVVEDSITRWWFA